MANLPDPLKDDFDVPAIRILSDRGIKQAIEQDYLMIDPPIDLTNPGKRLQPATIDLKFSEVGSHFSPGTESGKEFSFDSYQNLDAGKVSWIEFEEAIRFNYPTMDFEHIKSVPVGFFDCFLDGRSSLLRLGAVVTGRPTFFSGIEATIFNTSQNNIILEKEERIAQAFFQVIPFADTYGVKYSGKPPLTKEGDKVRELEMGVQANEDSQLEALCKNGFMKVERENGSLYVPWNGLILLHANKAFRMKEITGGIEFAKRDQYKKEDLLEEVNITKKYHIKEGEHLIVEVEEKLELSPHVGISVLNNLVNQKVPGAPALFGFSPGGRNTEERMRKSIINCALNCARNSWFDPGYKGMMTGFPKLLGKTVEKGDIVGYAQVFYFPKGVERPYGSKDLGSHFQGQKDFKVVAK